MTSFVLYAKKILVAQGDWLSKEPNKRLKVGTSGPTPWPGAGREEGRLEVNLITNDR